VNSSRRNVATVTLLVMSVMLYAMFRIHRLSSLFYVVAVFLFNTDVPRVHGLPVRVYLPRGLTGRVDCPTDANPPMNMVTWSKNERIIDVTTSTTTGTMRFKVNRQGSLIIRPVEIGDEGRYTCTPYSSLGVGQQSMPVQVLVRGRYINVV